MQTYTISWIWVWKININKIMFEVRLKGILVLNAKFLKQMLIDMSKESNSNWKNGQKQKGDCLYQAFACLKLSPPAMKLWEAFENVCLDWLIFPVLRKSLKIIKTIIKLFDKTFSQKWEIRSWDKTMNSIPLFCLYLCSLSSSTETPWTYTSFWSIKQIYVDMHVWSLRLPQS